MTSGHKSSVSISVSQILKLDRAGHERLVHQVQSADEFHIYFDTYGMDAIAAIFFGLEPSTRAKIRNQVFGSLKKQGEFSFPENLKAVSKFIEEDLSKKGAVNDDGDDDSDGGDVISTAWDPLTWGAIAGFVIAMGAIALVWFFWDYMPGFRPIHEVSDAINKTQMPSDQEISQQLQQYLDKFPPPIIHGPGDPNGPIGDSYPWNPFPLPEPGDSDTGTSGPDADTQSGQGTGPVA